MSAIADVAAERARQVNGELFEMTHDDAYQEHQLAQAAAAYALVGTNLVVAAEVWPWTMKWLKSTTHRRNCVKAAALLVAEIERIDRAANQEVG